MTTACLPAGATPVLSISFMQPQGVQGRKPGSPVISSPAERVEKPSTSLRVEIASITRCGLMCFGSGICTRMPCTLASAFSAAMRASSSVSVSAASYFSNSERTPLSAQALTLLRT